VFFLIVATDIPERTSTSSGCFLRTEAARFVPERFRFYEMLYESDSNGLLDQFRRRA